MENENVRMEDTKENKEAQEKQKGGSLLGEWIRDIAIAAVIAFLVTLVIKPTVVKESSMEPNFYEDDYLFLNKLAYKFGSEPAKGDVIVFRTKFKDDKGKNKLYIKRVIGVPGDTINIENDKVYINGEEDEQSYTKDGLTPTGDGDSPVNDLKVPEGKLFCMGDNRLVSIDSRNSKVGLINEKDIVGKAVFRLMPLSKIGLIKNVYK